MKPQCGDLAQGPRPVGLHPPGSCLSPQVLYGAIPSGSVNFLLAGCMCGELIITILKPATQAELRRKSEKLTCGGRAQLVPLCQLGLGGGHLTDTVCETGPLFLYYVCVTTPKSSSLSQLRSGRASQA